MMSTNGRLLLLVLVTGLFMRVWMVNSRTRQRNLPATRSQVAIRLPPPDPTEAARAREVVVRPVSIVRQSIDPVDEAFRPPISVIRIPGFFPAATEESWTETNCPIPLPAGIGNGTWRVVDDTGRVARLEIASSPAVNPSTSAPVVAPELCVTSVGSTRWYFIRLHQPVVAELPAVPLPGEPAYSSTTHSATGSERPLFTNRKFDFTGYVPQNWDASPDSEEIARPEPPDLPVPR
jgi:hypothetical protein